jgi:transposase-like protein
LYHCFSLSLRDVELILAARGIVVSYESIRDGSVRARAKIAGLGNMLINAAVERS